MMGRWADVLRESDRWRNVGRIAIVGLLLVEVALFFYLYNRGRVTSNDGSIRADSQATPAERGDERSSERIAYTFSTPSGFTVTEEGTTHVLKNADRSIIVSIGLMDGSRVGVVSDQILRLLDSTYEDLRVVDEGFDPSGSSYTVEGEALNEEGVRLDLTAVTVAAEVAGCSYQIIAFSNAGIDRSRVDSAVNGLRRTLDLSDHETCASAISA